MSSAPDQPKIYHITHLNNLSRIVSDGVVWSEAERIRRAIECVVVGMSEIKRRRLYELEVKCHPGTRVGQYVPFYFCPRSIMLYILHRGNHPEVRFQGGQRPIVHLQADLQTVVRWANEFGVRWAFSHTNAGAKYARFYRSLEELNELNWAAIAATDFRDLSVKEGKQAEFLVFEAFPWNLVERIGVVDRIVLDSARGILSQAEHRPPAAVESSWYF